MTAPLTPDELAELERDNAARKGDAYATAAEVHDMAVELIAARELLATPMPCGWPEPYAIDLETMPVQPRVRWESLEVGTRGLHPDEAIALGAALIRAAIAARARAGRGESE